MTEKPNHTTKLSRVGRNDIQLNSTFEYNMSPKFMKFYEKYMTVVGTVGNFMFYVQAHKIFTCKSAASVSLPAFTISAVALSSRFYRCIACVISYHITYLIN